MPCMPSKAGRMHSAQYIKSLFNLNQSQSLNVECYKVQFTPNGFHVSPLIVPNYMSYGNQ